MHSRLRRDNGYTVLELIISIGILMIVSSVVMDGVMRMTRVSGSVSNRSEMHASVRNATELLQQEIGQAGRITLPVTYTLAAASLAVPGEPPADQTVTLAANPATPNLPGIFVGQKLVVSLGTAAEETVEVTAVNRAANQITVAGPAANQLPNVANAPSFKFHNAHPAGARIAVHGGFAHGVIPDDPAVVANPSDGFNLKIFGDVNGNGRMVYVEYTCDVNGGNLYRRSVDFDSAGKPGVAAEHSLISTLTSNPGNTPCFTYRRDYNENITFITDVAITLTVNTPAKDPITGVLQSETKALLNVSPRNVFNVWQMAGMTIMNRVQPTPPSVTTLLTLP